MSRFKAMPIPQYLNELVVEWRTVTLALPAEIDRALELVAARRGWTKKETVAWALTGRAAIRAELAQDGAGRTKQNGGKR